MGRDNNILVNQQTGEINGTHVVSYKHVDDAKFIKLFSGNIAVTFDLTLTARRVFDIVVRVLQEKVNSDTISLSIHDLVDIENEFNIKMSSATLSKGIGELIVNGILARTKKQSQYFINPSFMFNGNRIAFTTVLERD